MVKVKTMEDKDFEPKGGKYFDAGVHVVMITGVERGKATTGSEYIEFQLLGQNDEVGNTRMYLTEKAAERTIAILGAVAVHNKESEAEKQGVRDAFKAIDDTDKIDAAFLKKFVNMEAWILAEEDLNAPKPNGGYYLRYNLYSYEPKARKQTAADIMGASTVADKTDIDAIPFE